MYQFSKLSFFFKKIQIDLEPEGKIKIRVDVKWTQEATATEKVSRRQMTQTKEQPFLNRRRGAMRRRVHQVRLKNCSSLNLLRLINNYFRSFFLLML